MNERTAKFNTLCRDCIFAQYDENHSLQIGCELGRLDRFKSKNKTELIKDKETDLEYYSINTICNTCRNDSSIYSNSATEILKEVQTTFDYIILADSKEENWQHSMLKTAESFLSHSPQPNQIILGCYQKKILFHTFSKQIQEIIKNTDIKFQIVNVLESVYDTWALIDILVKKCKNQYYTLYETNGRLPDNWINKIDNYINIELNSLSMLEPISGLTGLTIQKMLHQMVGGSQGICVTDKIKELAKEQQLENMIQHWSNL